VTSVAHSSTFIINTANHTELHWKATACYQLQQMKHSSSLQSPWSSMPPATLHILIQGSWKCSKFYNIATEKHTGMYKMYTISKTNF